MKTKLGLALGIAVASTMLMSGAQSAERAHVGYKIVPLVADQAGVAPNTDPNLVNPWGLCQVSDSNPVWVADNGTDKSTFYDRHTGVLQFPIVSIPHGAPTGCVAAPNGVNFNLTENGPTGRALFLFDSEAGAISGWAPSIDQNNAIIGFDGAAQGSAYKGLGIDATNKHLLAADFANNQVQIIDTSWSVVGTFTDPGLPRNFAPFNVTVLNGKIYVAFAKRAKHSIDEVDGAGLGYIDVFDLSGNLQTHLISNGALNAPWGMAIAPSQFGAFSGALLVGNFGDGKINAYDATTGDFLGTLGNKRGKALKIDGLWALDAGPGNATVQFSAGPDGETHGLLGNIVPN